MGLDLLQGRGGLSHFSKRQPHAGTSDLLIWNPQSNATGLPATGRGRGPEHHRRERLPAERARREKTSFNFSDDLTWIHGRHSWKFGFRPAACIAPPGSSSRPPTASSTFANQFSAIRPKRRGGTGKARWPIFCWEHPPAWRRHPSSPRPTAG